MEPRAEAESILVVDDTADNLRLLASFLEPLGYEVRPATSGRQALVAAELAPPDLVLLDVNMPEMTGYEVCEAFKARPALADVPIVFLTALTDISDKVRAFAIGGVDFITKPFHLEEVQARVKTHLALRRAHVELRASYAKLQRLERLRDDLVHMVVHDMRSPLMVLSAHLTMLEGEADRLSAEGAADVRSAVSGARRLARMANDLLDVSRMEDHRLPLQLADADLGALAERVKRQLRGIDHGERVELDVATWVRARCDESLIARVLENLLTNALQHAPGSKVRVELTVVGDRARFEVADDGPGVPEEARARIFDKFGSLATRKATGYHSAGLGLAFCKLAVSAHRGSIGVAPREPQGSRFWFELPISSDR